MTKQTINVGAAANDGTGDTERAAWIKANANFDELYGGLGHPGFVSGNWYAGGPAGAGNTVAAAADLFVAHPFFAPAAVTLQALGLRVTAGVASTNVRLGIYANAGGVPGAKLAELAAPVSTATSGSDASGSFSSNPALPPGWYWLATLFDGAPTVVGTNIVTDLPPMLIGGTALSQVVSNGGKVAGRNGTATYAGGLPASFGTSTIRTAVTPVIALRIA